VTPLWLALVENDPGCDLAGAVTNSDGTSAGVLCCWRGKDRPHHAALQADPRLPDPAGPACVVSIALAPARGRPIADDPAVVHARRAVLRDGRPLAVSLLTDDPVTIAGAITVARADRPDQVLALRDDPFARLWPARVLHLAPGLLGSLIRPTGPSLERYGGKPWPYDRF